MQQSEPAHDRLASAVVSILLSAADEKSGTFDESLAEFRNVARQTNPEVVEQILKNGHGLTFRDISQSVESVAIAIKHIGNLISRLR